MIAEFGKRLWFYIVSEIFENWKIFGLVRVIGIGVEFLLFCKESTRNHIFTILAPSTVIFVHLAIAFYSSFFIKTLRSGNLAKCITFSWILSRSYPTQLKFRTSTSDMFWYLEVDRWTTFLKRRVTMVNFTPWKVTSSQGVELTEFKLADYKWLEKRGQTQMGYRILLSL